MREKVVKSIGGGVLELLEGDITGLATEAIVNPANSSLQLGGGVAGAIRRRGGSAIKEACDRIGHCPTGGAVATPGGDLAAAYVIHAVGPVWNPRAPAECDRLLGSACREALARAEELGLDSIALPAISTGIFGFPAERAARVLLREAAIHLESGRPPRRVVFCLFGAESFLLWRRLLEA